MADIGQDRWRRGMAEIFGELNRLYDADEIGAVIISIARRDGDLRTLKAYDNGFKILLIAAAAIAAKESMEIVGDIDRDLGNWVEPAP